MSNTAAAALKPKAPTDLFRLAWPVGMEHLLNMSLLWVDSIIINRKLGTEAFAAIQMSGQIFNMISLILIIVATGASIVIAHQIGGGQREEAGQTASQSIGMGVLLSALLGVTIYAAAGPVLRMLGASGEVLTLGVLFTRLLVAFLPAQALISILSAILRATGNTRGPMMVTLVINVVNAALNYLWVWGTPAFAIGGLEIPALGGTWGLFGSGLGTSLARTAGAVLLLLMLLRTAPLPVRLVSAFRFQAQTLLRVARMGLPGALEFISYQGSQFVLTMLVAPLGTAAIAARGLTFQAESFTYVPAVSMGVAASILVGQKMGAGRREEAVATGRQALTVGMGGIALLAAILFLFPRPVAAIFTSDPEVLAYASVALRISALYKIGQCVNVVGGGIFRGAGNPQWPTLLTTGGAWLITVPMAYLAVRLGYGLEGVLWAMFTDEVVRGAINLWYFRTPHWRFRQV